MAVALFDPEPIGKSKGWRQQQEIDGQDKGGQGMEANIRQKSHLEFLGNDELFINQGYATI
ncbi:MAG: hypothetical protein Q9212_006405 [Teloschistes hypoglaucus]